MQFQITLSDGTKEIGSGKIFVLTLDNGKRIQIEETESGVLEIMSRDGSISVSPKVSNVIEVTSK